MTVTDDELQEGLSPVNNFQPTGDHIPDVTKKVEMESNAEEASTAQATAPTDNQTSVDEVVQVDPLQPDGEDNEEAESRIVIGEIHPGPYERFAPGVAEEALQKFVSAVGLDNESDVRPSSVEQGSAQPPLEVASVDTSQPKVEEAIPTARANEESIPVDNEYELEQRPVITVTGANNTETTTQETTMADDEWSTTPAVEATPETPNPVEVTRTDIRAMPVEEGDFETRYRNWEKVHASRQASILAKMKARDDKYAEMESTIDAENEKLSSFKTDRLG